MRSLDTVWERGGTLPVPALAPVSAGLGGCVLMIGLTCCEESILMVVYNTHMASPENKKRRRMSAGNKDKENDKSSTESLSQPPISGGRAFALELDKAVDERTQRSSEEAERLKKELEFKEATINAQSQYQVGGSAAASAALTRPRNVLQCSICMEYMIEPYGLTCGHVACFSCLHSWFTRDTNGNPRTAKVCPSCRAPIRSRPNELFIVKELAQITAAAHSESLDVPPTRNGDVWAKVFRPGGEYQPVMDREDGVMRCGRCTGELVGGVCTQCGELYTDAESDEWSEEDGEEENSSEDEMATRVTNAMESALGLESRSNRRDERGNWVQENGEEHDEHGESDEGDDSGSERERVRNLLTATDRVRRTWDSSFDRRNSQEHPEERSDHSHSNSNSPSSQSHSNTPVLSVSSTSQRLSPASAFFGVSERPGWERYNEDDEEDDFINNSRNDVEIADSSSNVDASEEEALSTDEDDGNIRDDAESHEENHEKRHEYDHWLPNQAESSFSAFAPAPPRRKKVIISDEDDE
ncbi:hypothetical protein E3P77_03979 [Wallemia ichthyophaga]|nr:hypothetical protein E3P77_03979 [Wallemia ichthyophaga]